MTPEFQCSCTPFYSPNCSVREHRQGAWNDFRNGIKPTPQERKLLAKSRNKSWLVVRDDDYYDQGTR